MTKNDKRISGLGLAVLLFGVSAVARKGAAGTWSLVRGEPPPKDLANRDVTIKDAVGWALLSGAVVGLARLAVRRGVVYPGSPLDKK